MVPVLQLRSVRPRDEVTSPSHSPGGAGIQARVSLLQTLRPELRIQISDPCSRPSCWARGLRICIAAGSLGILCALRHCPQVLCVAGGRPEGQASPGRRGTEVRAVEQRGAVPEPGWGVWPVTRATRGLCLSLQILPDLSGCLGRPGRGGIN